MVVPLTITLSTVRGGRVPKDVMLLWAAVVTVAAVPDVLPVTLPVTSPVTLPVKAPINPVAVIFPVLGL